MSWGQTCCLMPSSGTSQRYHISYWHPAFFKTLLVSNLPASNPPCDIPNKMRNQEYTRLNASTPPIRHHPFVPYPNT